MLEIITAYPLLSEPCRHPYIHSTTDFAGLNTMCVQECNRYDKGFTMIELMIVVAIVGIASTIAIPNFLEMIRQSQLKEAALEVANKLTTARMAAMNRNKAVTVALVATGGLVHVSATESSTGSLVIPDAPLMGQVNQVSGGPVTFNSLGMRTTGTVGNQLVALTTVSNKTYSVIVAANGKIYPCFKTTCP